MVLVGRGGEGRVWVKVVSVMIVYIAGVFRRRVSAWELTTWGLLECAGEY